MSTTTRPTPTPGSPVTVIGTQQLYLGGLTDGWQDFGWSPDRKITGGPAVIDMGEWFGWLIARPNQFVQASTLEFRYKTDRDYGPFLLVTVGSPNVENYEEVLVVPRKADKNGWFGASVPVASMNPTGQPMDRIRFRPSKRLSRPLLVSFEGIRFAGDGKGLFPKAGAVPVVVAGKGKRKAMSVDCRADRHRISPLVYGIGWSGAGNLKDPPWGLNAAANRWGGNPTSRYNFESGNAWNTAADYYFRNVQVTAAPNASEEFLAENNKRGIVSAVTLPMLGWVAKDQTSYSFPVSEYGQQKENDPDIPDAGNGVGRNGKNLASPDPSRTSVASTPESVAAWVAKLRGRSAMYFLDNEPELWDSTHRDVRPDPLGYDELLDRTIRYATATRAADPKAIIAGPSSWGWLAYFYSGIDAKAGFNSAPDRKAHGNEPLLEWYLRNVRAYENKNNVRLLDVLDVHFYPQAENVYGGGRGGVDPGTAEKRIRQTRGLWDPKYRDESWIDEEIRLIPRLKEIVAKNAPGLGVSIGEWNFGGEQHISGGLAVAEALGRFGLYDLYSAFYWTSPPTNSPAYWGFRAFRNYDGNGATFLPVSVRTTMDDNVSLFASTDEQTKKFTAVLLNLHRTEQASAVVSLKNCGSLSSYRTYTYGSNSTGLVASPAIKGSTAIGLELAPWTITVVSGSLT